MDFADESAANSSATQCGVNGDSNASNNAHFAGRDLARMADQGVGEGVASYPGSACRHGLADFRAQSPLQGDQAGRCHLALFEKRVQPEVGCIQHAMKIAGRGSVVGMDKETKDAPEKRFVFGQLRLRNGAVDQALRHFRGAFEFGRAFAWLWGEPCIKREEIEKGALQDTALFPPNGLSEFHFGDGAGLGFQPFHKAQNETAPRAFVAPDRGGKCKMGSGLGHHQATQKGHRELGRLVNGHHIEAFLAARDLFGFQEFRQCGARGRRLLQKLKDLGGRLPRGCGDRDLFACAQGPSQGQSQST
jgi:hypothetical protein